MSILGLCGTPHPQCETTKMVSTFKAAVIMIIAVMTVMLSAGCGSPAQSVSDSEKNDVPVELSESAQAAVLPKNEPQERVAETEETNMESSLRLFINDTEVTVTWEDNEAVRTLAALVSFEPLAVQMSMYGGFEQVGSLGTALPRNDSQTTTQAGDIVLYSGDQIVVFYGSNSWAYTRLGRITDRTASELKELLGNSDVIIRLSLE